MASLKELYVSVIYVSMYVIYVVRNDNEIDRNIDGTAILFLLHPELSRERSIRFLLFEIKRVFVYISTIFKLTELFILNLFIPNVYANKKLFKKKGYKIVYKGFKL